MKTTFYSPVEPGRCEDAALASFIFIPREPTPKPHPDFNVSGLIAGLIYSALVAAFFTGIGYLSLWIVEKVVSWL